jgi:hypothetical protein
MAKENAKKLLADYGVPFSEAGAILATYKDIKVKDETDLRTMELARSKRLELRQHRIAIEKRHDVLKADSLATGRAIDLVQRVALAEITPAEDYLKGQEEFAIRKEEERVAKLIVTRTEALEAVGVDVSIYNLGELSDEAFDKILATAKKDFEAEEARLAKEEADKIAEEERIEAERVKALKDAKIAREKAEAELEEVKKANAEVQAKADAEAEKLRKEKAELQAEIDRKQAIEDEEAKLEAERLEAEEAEKMAEEKKTASTPDKDKIVRWIEIMESGTSNMNLQTTEGIELFGKIKAHFVKTMEMYKEQVESAL